MTTPLPTIEALVKMLYDLPIASQPELGNIHTFDKWRELAPESYADMVAEAQAIDALYRKHLVEWLRKGTQEMIDSGDDKITQGHVSAWLYVAEVIEMYGDDIIIESGDV